MENILERYKRDIIDRAKKIKLFMLDVDGVLTDGSLIYDAYGERVKPFNVNDGLGIYFMRKAGIKCVIVTAKASPAVRRRAKELKMDALYQNFHKKSEALIDAAGKFGVSFDEVCFVGDDIIDVPIFKKAGLSVCPSSAMRDVKPYVHLITQRSGGEGAVREICDLILKAQGLWDKVVGEYFE